MKYIHIVQFHLMSGGGVGSVITDLCEAMAKESNEVYVISLFRRGGIDFELERKWGREHGINVLLMQEDVHASSLMVLKKLRKALKILCKNDTCCLFLHLKWGVLAGIISSLGLQNIRRVEVYHSGYMRYKLQAFVCKHFVHKYISVSKEAKKQLINWFHVKPDKIEVAYNGVDIEHIKDMASHPIASESAVTFLSVGRLSFEKGFLTSIEAFGTLFAEGKLRDCQYTMIGQGVQMNEAKELSKGHVTFTGLIPRDSVYGNIAGCDVMILPSWWEGNSILLLEALAIGKAMIVSDIPSFREVLGFQPLCEEELCRLEPFGAVFRAKNVESCKSAIILMKDNSNHYEKMAEYVSLLAQSFSISNQVDIYKEVASSVFA